MSFPSFVGSKEVDDSELVSAWPVNGVPRNGASLGLSKWESILRNGTSDQFNYGPSKKKKHGHGQDTHDEELPHGFPLLRLGRESRPQTCGQPGLEPVPSLVDLVCQNLGQDLRECGSTNQQLWCVLDECGGNGPLEMGTAGFLTRESVEDNELGGGGANELGGVPLVSLWLGLDSRNASSEEFDDSLLFAFLGSDGNDGAVGYG